MSKKFDVETFFEYLDSKDYDGFASCLASDCTVVLGNQPPIVGKDAIVETLSTMYASLAGVKHEQIENWESNGHRKLVVHGRVTYILDEARQVTLPFMDLYIIEDGLLKEANSFYDPAPFYELLHLSA